MQLVNVKQEWSLTANFYMPLLMSLNTNDAKVRRGSAASHFGSVQPGCVHTHALTTEA